MRSWEGAVNRGLKKCGGREWERCDPRIGKETAVPGVLEVPLRLQTVCLHQPGCPVVQQRSYSPLLQDARKTGVGATA